jgi:hypothetical protein
MRKIIMTLAAVCSAFMLNAQTADFSTNTFSTPSFFSAKKAAVKGSDAAFDKGKIMFSAGYGFPSIGTNWFSSYESFNGYSASAVGPLFFKFGYGVSDSYELGINVNYSQATASFNTGINNQYKATMKYNSLSALVRLTKHFGVGEKLDPYWTTSLGYRNIKFTYDDNDPNFAFENASISLPFSFEVGIGARYYFMPNVGVYAEAGISRAPFQVGLVAQF